MNVFGDLLTFLRQERFRQFLEQTPFGVFYEIHHIKIQCQLLRHLLLLETENVRDDIFIVKINVTVLRFEIKEFAAVTGLKCGLLNDFVSDPSIPNRLIQKYFGEMTKVPKLDFLNKFKEASFFEPEDRFKIGVQYFISTFLTGSEASKKTIPKLYFDLVESGQYVNFPWGNECFRLTLKVCSRRLGNNLTSFKSTQFHLALQIWFYECCHPFDNTVAIRVSTGTPRILNWNTSNESIFFKDLNNTIFRTYGNQHKFKNIVLTDEEMNVIDQNNLRESSSHHETENQATSERNDVDFDENYVELKKETAENSIDQTIGGVFNADILGSSTSKPPTLDDYPDLTMTQIVELDLILNANTTPDVQPRNRNPNKYDTSPYIRLSKGDSSVGRGPIFCRIKHPFESHNGFEVAAELIDEFNKWVFKGVSPKPSRKSAYSKIKDKFEPQMNFGVVKVSEINFFNIMVKTGRPWKDGKQWRDSNYDMSSISPDHDVGQCIRGFKLLANIPWDRVDDIIIPVNVSKSFH
uniref:Ulp1 protease family, C-terminal catalytic domain containing protein n=1 Tax=Solanum tuberosum TaxID=4113 RepID=M1DIW9_SOLTU